MGTLEQQQELVTYELDQNEAVMDGLLAAFDAIGYNLTDRKPPITAFIAPHPINTLQWENPKLTVTTSVWSHPVKISADQIIIHAAEEDSERMSASSHD